MNRNSSKIIGAPAMLLSGLASICCFLSCEGTGPTAKDLDNIVVQAFLCPGRPVNNIRLKFMGKNIASRREAMEVWNKETGEIDTVDTLVYEIYERYIDDATITISNNNSSYPLASRDSGWYYEPGGTLVITMGQTYRIDVTAAGKQVWAETTVPVLESGITTTRDTVYLAQSDEDTCGKNGCDEKYPEGSVAGVKKTAGGTGIPDSLRQLTVRWFTTTPGYVVYHYSEEGGSGGGYLEKTADSLTIRCGTNNEGLDYVHMSESGLIVPKIGNYKIVFYLTAQDYGMFINNYFYSGVDSTRQDQWAGSPTNIHGGVGIFSSYCIDSCTFEVVPWQGGT